MRATVFVKEARVEVQPTEVAIESLSTSFGEATMQVKNMGDDPSVVTSIVLNETLGWLSVAKILDGDVVVALPYEVPSGGALQVYLQGAGTAVDVTPENGAPYRATGTVMSSSGDEPSSQALQRIRLRRVLLHFLRCFHRYTCVLVKVDHNAVYHLQRSCRCIQWEIESCQRVNLRVLAMQQQLGNRNEGLVLTFAAWSAVGEYLEPTLARSHPYGPSHPP